MRKIIAIGILVCFSLTACKHTDAGKQPLPVQTMKLVMWDMLKADEWYLVRSLKDSTLRTKKENIQLFEQVFQIHGITRDRFYSSYRYYEAHPLEMKVLIDSIDLYAGRERNKVYENHGQAKK
jgi:hypothetical protein